MKRQAAVLPVNGSNMGGDDNCNRYFVVVRVLLGQCGDPAGFVASLRNSQQDSRAFALVRYFEAHPVFLFSFDRTSALLCLTTDKQMSQMVGGQVARMLYGRE